MPRPKKRVSLHTDSELISMIRDEGLSEASRKNATYELFDNYKNLVYSMYNQLVKHFISNSVDTYVIPEKEEYVQMSFDTFTKALASCKPERWAKIREKGDEPSMYQHFYGYLRSQNRDIRNHTYKEIGTTHSYDAMLLDPTSKMSTASITIEDECLNNIVRETKYPEISRKLSACKSVADVKRAFGKNYKEVLEPYYQEVYGSV